MSNYIKHPISAKIISFLISIIIVLIIFVGIIGIVIPLMLEGRIGLIRVISLLFILTGALIIILARHWPIIHFIHFIKKTVKIDTTLYNFIGSLLIGLSFLIAGLVYIRSKNFNMMLIPFVSGIFLIRLMIYHIKHKIKTMPRIYTPPQEEDNQNVNPEND